MQEKLAALSSLFTNLAEITTLLSQSRRIVLLAFTDYAHSARYRVHLRELAMLHLLAFANYTHPACKNDLRVIFTRGEILLTQNSQR